MATLKQLQAVASDVVALLGEYPHFPTGEMQVDRVLYAFLKGRFGVAASRQWPTNAGGKGRIDFRLGGNNPIVFELATKTSQGGSLSVGSNAPELLKLSRIPKAQARVRALLLMNLTSDALDFERLRAGYTSRHVGPGKFERQPVSIVYVSTTEQRRFPWSPYK